MSVSVVPTLDMERAIAASGFDVIVGFDEVGRGSLAGPVMVGAPQSARAICPVRRRLPYPTVWPIPKC